MERVAELEFHEISRQDVLSSRKFCCLKMIMTGMLGEKIGD